MVIIKFQMAGQADMVDAAKAKLEQYQCLLIMVEAKAKIVPGIGWNWEESCKKNSGEKEEGKKRLFKRTRKDTHGESPFNVEKRRDFRTKDETFLKIRDFFQKSNERKLKKEPPI